MDDAEASSGPDNSEHFVQSTVRATWAGMPTLQPARMPALQTPVLWIFQTVL